MNDAKCLFRFGCNLSLSTLLADNECERFHCSARACFLLQPFRGPKGALSLSKKERKIKDIAAGITDVAKGDTQYVDVCSYHCFNAHAFPCFTLASCNSPMGYPGLPGKCGKQGSTRARLSSERCNRILSPSTLFRGLFALLLWITT